MDSGDNVKHDACTTCHNADGTLQNSWTSGDCTQCHSDIDNGTTLNLFAHDVDHDTSSYVTLATACQDCHSTTVAYPVFTDSGDNVKHDSCSTCHTSATNLTLVTNALPGAGGNADCQTCHTGTWTALHTTPTAQPDHSTAVSGINKCTSCHDATAGTTTGIPTSLANNMVHDDCAACHNADGSLKAGASAGNDGVANCADCHGLYNTDFAAGHQNEDHGNVAAVAPCSSCHTGNVISSARIHEDNCFTSSCHVSSSDGTLTNSAAGHTVGSPSDCTDCHGAVSHDTNTDHNRRTIAWGTNPPADLVCSTCHTSDNTNVGQAGTGTLTSQADVDALHDKNWDGTVMANQCELCHWYDAATQAKDGEPTQAKVDGAIADGKAGTADASCITCHDYNRLAANHGGHTPTDFGWSPSCSASACHNEAGNSDIVASPDVHDNQCGLCHVNPGGGGTLRSYAVGKTISESTTCVDLSRYGRQDRAS